MARLLSEQSPLLQSATDASTEHPPHLQTGRQKTLRDVANRQHPPCHAFLHGLLTVFWDDTGEHIVQGCASIFLLGSVLGLVVPRSSHLHGQWYPLISNMLGYCYACAWSVSYYPQLILNYKRQSTEGLSVDFCILSVFGCACYALLNVAMFYSPHIQTLYGKRHDGHACLVQPSDVAFSIHALILSSIWLGQIWYYNNNERRRSVPQQQQQQQYRRGISKTTIALLGLLSSLFMVYGLLIVTLAPSSSSYCNNVRHDWDNWLCNRLNWLDFLYVVTTVKIANTLLSYLPQALLQFSLKSTDGFNIWNMLLDAFGGILSLLQLLLDSWNEHDMNGISGAAAKLALALVSIGLDVSVIILPVLSYGGNWFFGILSEIRILTLEACKVIFLVQHYILYPIHATTSLQTVAQTWSIDP